MPNKLPEINTIVKVFIWPGVPFGKIKQAFTCLSYSDVLTFNVCDPGI